MRTRWIESIEPDEITRLLEGLIEVDLVVSKDSETADDRVQVSPEIMGMILRGLVRATKRTQSKFRRTPLGTTLIGLVDDLYRRFPADFHERAALLEIFSNLADESAIEAFGKLILEDPPQDSRGLDQAFVPLFQRRDNMALLLFPDLLDAISQPGLATIILDLANYLTRNQIAKRHPATDQSDRLATLLGNLVQDLAKLESPAELPTEGQEDARTQVANGVALGVALCDSLALIGDSKHVGKLFQASELGHRRLRVEAFAALAKLGEDEGKKQLIALVEEPSMRLRAIHYAEELDLDNQIDDRFRSDEALAEAELASWLSEPLQFGIPPTEMSHYERRSLMWPGFQEPVECFLIRFAYRFGDHSYSNVGIAGPFTHAFVSDLNDLPPNDMYAAFAGWQGTHQDIYDIPYEQRDASFEAEREKLEERAESLGCKELEWEAVGVFFGERILYGKAVRQGQPGSLAISMFDHSWYPELNSPRPVDPQLAFCILKGRRFLKSFNPEGFEIQSDDSQGNELGSS